MSACGRKQTLKSSNLKNNPTSTRKQPLSFLYIIEIELGVKRL